MFARHGKLEKALRTKAVSILPFTETIQKIEVPHHPDGSAAVDDEHIQAEKEALLAGLREKYGEIDDQQIEWVMVRKQK